MINTCGWFYFISRRDVVKNRHSSFNQDDEYMDRRVSDRVMFNLLGVVMMLVIFIKIILYQHDKAFLYLIINARDSAFLNHNEQLLFEESQL
ncbi:hypothetical protein [Providencia manganoxydans]|uniref:hypothetical protein n=1 Tax=Providencia manganoxydans TaxID=2923283 RepID=UPI0028951603